MSGTLIVTAFGRHLFRPGQSPWDGEEDLYSVFLARSELMGWSRIGSSAGPDVPLLWGMNDAELSQDDGPQIGWVQVGLDVHCREELDIPDFPPAGFDLPRGLPSAAGFAAVPETGTPVDPALAIPPLIRCVDDSLRWFGEAEVSAYELIAHRVVSEDIPPRNPRYATDLLSALAWFTVGALGPVRALVTMTTGQVVDRLVRDVFDVIHPSPNLPLRFERLVNSRDGYPTASAHWPFVWAGTDTAIEVSLPEWSADAVGWVVARVVDAALSLDPAPHHLSVRVARAARE